VLSCTFYTYPSVFHVLHTKCWGCRFCSFGEIFHVHTRVSCCTLYNLGGIFHVHRRVSGCIFYNLVAALRADRGDWCCTLYTLFVASCVYRRGYYYTLCIYPCVSYVVDRNFGGRILCNGFGVAYEHRAPHDFSSFLQPLLPRHYYYYLK